MSATTVCKLALLGQCTLTASWHLNFPGSSLLCNASYRKSLGHLLHCPPPSSYLIYFHHLSSNYGVVHFILSADGGGAYEFWEVESVLLHICSTGNAAVCKSIDAWKNVEFWYIVFINAFEIPYTISLACLLIPPFTLFAFSMAWLKGIETRTDQLGGGWSGMES